MTTVTLDMETAKLLAEAAASTAAKEVASELKDEMRSEFSQMEERLTKRMDLYFGGADPQRHVVQHDRIERLLALVDRMGENLFTNIVKQILWGLIVMGVVGYLLWHKFTGGAG